jgi:drug/metabolite transporter (DMT)-like permease
MTPHADRIALTDWGLLLFLSLLWSGSFLFVGIAVKELPPLVIVAARVVMAAAALVPLHLLMAGPLPRDRESWLNYAVLGVLNNVLPFTLITTGQTMIASGLASVINATTPLFVAGLMALTGLERPAFRKVAGIMAGIAGVAVIKGGSLFGDHTQGFGILCGLAAAGCYALSSLWVRFRLRDSKPMTVATGQLLCSALVMTIVAFAVDDPALLFGASPVTWLALVGLALLSTSLAYLVFFRIIAGAGPANVQLVTMLIPVSAILMGYAVLDEALDAREIIGALIIIVALAIIDGRVFHLLGQRKNPA